MGGDAQPQIISQLLARLLRSGEDPARAISAPRLALDAPSAGPFRLWWGTDLTVLVEANAPETWMEGLDARGHRTRAISAFDPVAVGCAQIIAVERRADGERCLVAASDPRSPEGAAVGR
jgi:gamma-glutamyltranspeptidase/glutathione hydrolase